MLQGIAMILDESVQKGAVREIVLENGVLVLQRTYKFSVASVLVATKSSQTLRHAIDAFTEHFYDAYSQFFDNSSEIQNFATASKLVDEHFGFVPTPD
jgi:phage-related tail fiber protein